MKINGIKIDTHIPAPVGAMSKYRHWPFAEMNVGDSFVVPHGDIQALRSAATHFKVRSNGTFDYITRRTADGYRCWRIEVRE